MSLLLFVGKGNGSSLYDLPVNCQLFSEVVGSVKSAVVNNLGSLFILFRILLNFQVLVCFRKYI